MSSQTLTPNKIILTIVVLFIIGYSVFNSRFIIQGPEIEISGLDASGKIIRTDSKDFSLQGNAVHSSYITVNNRPISVDETGNFNEKLLLSNGVSIIDIYARDKFGKEVRKKIDVVYTGSDSVSTTSPEQIALRVIEASSTTASLDIEEESETTEVPEEDTVASSTESQ
jgi:zona occludens toxin (predicted ATPase)